jgi:rare lipoprotein A
VIARVTNLENGRSLIVRVNDRGPFAHDREIDMSMRAAELLGFKEQGTTKVRVQYLSRAADWKGEQGLQTAQAQPQSQPQATQPAARQVAAASAASMQPIRDDHPKDDDDSGIATAGLPPSPSMPMDVSLLAGAGSAAASVPSAITAPQAAPASQPPVSETPTRAMAPVTDNFFVQAGSFRSASNANSLATQLKDLGPVEVKETVVNGTPWYRVRVGPVDNAPGADSLLESVISRGQDGARVVVN